jgi:vacuolar-type H+-ATPase subunit D/Vma8
MAFIDSVLEEQEREDFSRMKFAKKISGRGI